MMVEVRVYKTKPGQRKGFLDIFCARSPERVGERAPVFGPFLCSDADTFLFMRDLRRIPVHASSDSGLHYGTLLRGRSNALLAMLEECDVIVADESTGILHWEKSRFAGFQSAE